ncbi:PEP-CTERM sorting domain-containing protein [Glaciimonas immobilis]|uniref:Ice-binding protein C-terminal domain-containing protein n=1 Tax=Glaciimonas immobilis TaxID=728004 RepID=A0A840RXY8_9BURK|nr:PEP-CTERM sorting domain-containing protein [Glaciimonas immobilis]KAF3998656.1 PEP-CTERM sorting domain-containing protein [Glaciimonas immobilis]MBB5201524.1 hypothetical protein [Glaciimonas immobilis]
MKISKTIAAHIIIFSVGLLVALRAQAAPTTPTWTVETIIVNNQTGLGSFTAADGNAFSFTDTPSTPGLKVGYYNGNLGDNSQSAILTDIKNSNLFGLSPTKSLTGIGLGDISGSTATIISTAAYDYLAVHVGGGELLFNWSTPTKSNFVITSNGSGSGGGLSNYRSFVSAVPEPETYAMLLGGLGLIGVIVRRRKSL